MESANRANTTTNIGMMVEVFGVGLTCALASWLAQELVARAVAGSSYDRLASPSASPTPQGVFILMGAALAGFVVLLGGAFLYGLTRGRTIGFVGAWVGWCAALAVVLLISQPFVQPQGLEMPPIISVPFCVVGAALSAPLPAAITILGGVVRRRSGS